MNFPEMEVVKLVSSKFQTAFICSYIWPYLGRYYPPEALPHLDSINNLDEVT